MKNYQRALKGMMLFLICMSANCSTLANYFLPPLNKRHLRISKEGPFTEYRWHEEICKKKLLGICVKHETVDHLEVDFNFEKEDDRAKFNDMGFDCSVREMPK